jgi:hypothetical protein
MNSFLGNINFGIHSGGILSILVLLPNLAWMIFPGASDPKPNKVPAFLPVLENVSRIAILLLPFFYTPVFNQAFSLPAGIGAALAQGVYYAAWIRYFTHGRAASLMRSPLWGIPLPLAVAPVVLFLFASLLIQSGLVFLCAVIFGFAHIWISALTL